MFTIAVQYVISIAVLNIKMVENDPLCITSKILAPSLFCGKSKRIHCLGKYVWFFYVRKINQFI